MKISLVRPWKRGSWCFKDPPWRVPVGSLRNRLWQCFSLIFLKFVYSWDKGFRKLSDREFVGFSDSVGSWLWLGMARLWRISGWILERVNCEALRLDIEWCPLDSFFEEMSHAVPKLRFEGFPMNPHECGLWNYDALCVWVSCWIPENSYSNVTARSYCIATHF